MARDNSNATASRGPSDEIQKLHRLAGKGMSLRAIAKALTRSEESIQARAKAGRAEGQQAAVRRPECLLSTLRFQDACWTRTSTPITIAYLVAPCVASRLPAVS